MRYGVASAAVLTLVVLGLPRLTSAEEKKPIVAVFGIETKDVKLKPSVLASLTNYLASKLSESGVYEVVPQDKLAEALAAKKKASYKQCYKQSCQIEIGQELAASKALATQVMKVGTKCTVTANFYDLAKKTSGKAATAKGPCSEDGIQGSIDEAVDKLTSSSAAPPSPPPSPSPMPTPAPTPTPAPAPTGRGWLGMILKNAGDGVVIVAVFKGTPAQKAGMQKGDVIVRMNKEPATSSTQIAKWVGSQSLGVKIIVGLKRQGKLRQVTAVPEDSSQAASVYRQACNDGDTGACTIVGRMFARGQGIPEDHAQAAAVWRKGCEAGAMDSCSGLGVQYLKGLGVAKDIDKAVQLYRKACEGGSMSGCNNLGMLHAKGVGVAKDPNKAAQLCRKACEGGSMSGCSNLGMLHAKGVGVAKDRARAVVLYRKACDGGNREGCKRLQMLVGK
jgi:hypothetical protein